MLPPIEKETRRGTLIDGNRESVAECATNATLVFTFLEGYLGHISPMIHDHLQAVENCRPEV